MTDTERSRTDLALLSKRLRREFEDWPPALTLKQIGTIISPTYWKRTDPGNALYERIQAAAKCGDLVADGPPVEERGICLADSPRFGLSRRTGPGIASREWLAEFATPCAETPTPKESKPEPAFTPKALARALHGQDLPELLAAWLAPWLGVVAPKAEGEPKLRSGARRNDLADELNPILRSMQDADELVNAATVMPKLQDRAGRKDSCIKKKEPDGIWWLRGSTGNLEELDYDALDERIRRWKEKNLPR